jgi:hypothetical protein
MGLLGEKYLKRFLRFFSLFIVLFTGNLIVNKLFKDYWNIDTAFSVAFGCSIGMAIVDYYLTKKAKKK